MGLFSSKTYWYVDSQIYNMAGDVTNRTKYMSSLAVQSALLGGNITQRIQNGLFNGPGNNIKSFFRWAAKNYANGMPIADITSDTVTDYALIERNIPLGSEYDPDSIITLSNAVITGADGSIWAESYLSKYYPEYLHLDWIIDHDDVLKQITISFVDETIPDIIFNADSVFPWDKTKTYLAARYNVIEPPVMGEVTPATTHGPYATVGAAQVHNYTLGEIRPDIPSTQVFTLVQKITTRTEYKDLRESTETSSYTNREYIYVPYSREYVYEEQLGFAANTQKMEYILHTKDLYFSKRKITNVSREVIEYSDRIEIITTETEDTQDSITYTYTTQRNQSFEQHPEEVFFYEFGSGNTELDSLRVTDSLDGNEREFLPMLPIRLDNRFIDVAPYKDTIYDDVSKAYRKSFGSKVDDLIDELKDNDSIGDIDFAFIVSGVTLNERDKAGKRYIYEFLKGLIPYQNTTKAEYENYRDSSFDFVLHEIAYQTALKNSMAGRATEKDKDILDAANKPKYPIPKKTTLKLDVNIRNVKDYHINLSWTYIHETIGYGLGKANAKRGDIWWELGTKVSRPSGLGNGLLKRITSNNLISSTNRVYLYYQEGDLYYKRLEIVGLVHENYVYAGKWVNSEAYDVVKEKSDEESSFFLPLHMPTINKLSLVDQNQLGYCSRLILFNSYVKVKKKWYQRGIFKVIFAVVMIVISVVMPGTGIAMAPGLLGTNLAVGTALGLAGTAAVIAGAVANMLVATILVSVIQKAAVKFLGDKLGALIGAVVSMVAIQVGTNFANTGNIAIDWNSFFKADNLIKLTEAVTSGITGFVQGKMEDLMEDYQKSYDKYKDSMKAIEDKFLEEFGPSAWIDPMLLTDALYGDELALRESSNTFLERTLLTGMDIARLTTSSISSFPDVSLELPKAIF